MSSDIAKKKVAVEHWDESTDGPLTEDNMKKKLRAQGFDFIKYTFSAGTEFPDHTHAFSKKDSIITGRFRFSMYGEEVIMRPGDMLEVPANTVHNASVVGHEPVIFFDATKKDF